MLRRWMLNNDNLISVHCLTVSLLPEGRRNGYDLLYTNITNNSRDVYTNYEFMVFMFFNI